MSIKQAALIEGVGGNETIALQYFETLTSLITVLLNTPDTNQASQISHLVTNLMKITKQLVALFPGMENFETDPVLLLNQKNAAFYELYNQLQSFAQELIVDPLSSLNFFSNKIVQEKIAKLIILAIGVTF